VVIKVDSKMKDISAIYYISRMHSMLRDFDKVIAKVKHVFVEHYGQESSEQLIRVARLEYEALIPELPYIGGKQPFTQFLITAAWFLAMYRTLQKQSMSTQEAGSLVYELTESFMGVYPQFVLRFLGFMSFSQGYLRKLHQRAIESQERKYTGDFVYVFVKGDGKTFDYGVDYLECGTCKFLQAQGAPELAPYLCATDYLLSEAYNWGLQRTMTLAEGFERCDFRFKKGGKTRIASSVLLLE
jgi:hypothetical protein